MVYRLGLAARRVFGWWLRLALGAALGLVLLEGVLRANPALLLRGMAVPAPVDPPLTVQTYTVRYSDGDLYFWHDNRIRPVAPEADRVEAEVRYETDEFGFPNAGPLPATVDVIVLGRSYAMGAQAEQPWPRRLAAQTGWKVLNLSQTGSGLDTRTDYLERFGWLRHPRWIVVEVLPSMDVLGYGKSPPALVEALPVPIIQEAARRAGYGAQPATTSEAIYPLAVDIPGRTANLVFFDYYLAALTVDGPMLAASQQWADYTQGLLQFAAQAQAHSACVALLYAPTKEEVYVSLAADPEQVAPALATVGLWRPNGAGRLVQDRSTSADPAAAQANAMAAHDLLAQFAEQHGLTWIDPSEALRQAALAGQDPFMVYDSHWSATGHMLVTEAAAGGLQQAACP